MDLFVFGALSIGALAILVMAGSSLPVFVRLGACTVAIVVLGLVLASPSQRYLDGLKWYQQTPWKEGALFICMITGMCTRSLADAIEDRRAKRKARPGRRKPALELDTWEFAYPLLFSAITFGVVLSATESTPLGFASGLLSFQNGFFWKSLIGRKTTALSEGKD